MKRYLSNFITLFLISIIPLFLFGVYYNMRLFVEWKESNIITNNNKHLTYNDRLDIEEGISKGKTFSSIGIELDKDPITIFKEIKRNL